MKPTYQPDQVEAKWYAEWERQGIFSPEYRPDGEPFVMVIPPPNVTGSLHIGHALNHTIQDVVSRCHRMKGRAVLWVPGSDHAGIATQAAVERALVAEGLDRHQLGREGFVDRIWQWKKEHGDIITNQIRRLGSSCDWSRERFTLDEGLSAAVREVFVGLYEQGMIYRGNRIINWCISCGTALADIEVEYAETEGEMCHISYPFVDGDGSITVATTRAETMLGDTGVAVHPDDPRYQDVAGRLVQLPLIGRHIPVVFDTAVDPEFGTGAVKVTPAHDLVDFEIGERNGLDPVVVLDEKGIVTAEGAHFEGMDRFATRKAVKEELTSLGLLEVESHPHSVGRCYRCDTVTEPRLSQQWFVKMDELAAPAIKAVKEGDCQFVPTRWEKNYFHWMENLRDWCISRQIWWGHRIPAYYCQGCARIEVCKEPPIHPCTQCGEQEWQQEEDVLDTWFSSALWPFSTLGWPESTPDLAKFYPNSILVTGFDIINFWVARMLMMGIHFLGQVPFHTTVVHGLLRDVTGRKMSKSLGNTIDPLEVVETDGADPLRLALLQATNVGQDIPFDIEWVKAARKFGNKLWNAIRYTKNVIGDRSIAPEGAYPSDPSPTAAWILSRLGTVTEAFDQAVEQYRFSEAYGLLYSFIWSEICDWYLEICKVELADQESQSSAPETLGVVMRDVLKLLHPAMPYLTEELWSELVGEGLIAGSDWPQPPASVEQPVEMVDLMEMIGGVRRFRSEHEISPKQPLNLRWLQQGSDLSEWGLSLVEGLANVNIDTVVEAPGSGHAPISTEMFEIFIVLEGLIDIDAERARLGKELAQTEKSMNQSQAKLSRPDFVHKAPPEIVQKEKDRLDGAQQRLTRLKQQLQFL